MKKLFVFMFVLISAGLVVNATTTVSTSGLDDVFNQVDQTINNLDGNYEELGDAVTFMSQNEITIHDNISDYMPDRNIRRDESAKVFYSFLYNVINEFEADFPIYGENTSQCEFSDLEGQTFGDLPNFVDSACRYGLFKGSNGKFTPTKALTNGQAVVVLIRMIDEEKDEVNVDHYVENYMQKADELGLLDNLDIKNKSMWDEPASRGTVALLIYRASLK